MLIIGPNFHPGHCTGHCTECQNRADFAPRSRTPVHTLDRLCTRYHILRAFVAAAQQPEGGPRGALCVGQDTTSILGYLCSYFEVLNP